MTEFEALYEHLEELSKQIPVINPSRQYWFIRTDGGKFFSDFWYSKTIGVGYNLVTIPEITKILAKENNQSKYIAALIEEGYPDYAQPARAAGMLTRFLYEVKPGDIVVMPSAGSHSVAFGEILPGKPFELDGKGPWNDRDRKETYVFRKRRKVKWLVRKTKEQLDSNLYPAFNSPQTLSTLNHYGDYIDRELYSIYTKGGETHLRLDVNESGGINGQDFFEMGYLLLKSARDFQKDAGLPPTAAQIDVRSNVQSEGLFEFIGHNSTALLWMAAIAVLAINGGGLKIKGLGLDLSTEGFMKRLQEYKNKATQRKLIEHALENNMASMDVSAAADLLRILGVDNPPPLPVNQVPPPPPPPPTLPQAPPTP